MFVHLRLHTEFSVVDSTNRIETLVNIAKQDGQPALAITDLNNLFGAIKFYKEARGSGLKPILGAEVMLEAPGVEQGSISRVILLVQNLQGYLNLCELISRAWTQNVQRENALVKWTWLEELNEGLILLDQWVKPWFKKTLLEPLSWRCDWPAFFHIVFIWSFSVRVAVTMSAMWLQRLSWRMV